MFGRVTDDLRDRISGLLRSDALAITVNDDSQGLQKQETANSWVVVDAESSRKEKMAELLAQLPAA
jgi:hypothetical protein